MNKYKTLPAYCNLDIKLHEKLAKIARIESRSISKQIEQFVKEGLERREYSEKKLTD